MGSSRPARSHESTASTSPDVRNDPISTALDVGRRSTSQGCTTTTGAIGRSLHVTGPNGQPVLTMTP
jgi:hypothetical protein